MLGVAAQAAAVGLAACAPPAAPSPTAAPPVPAVVPAAPKTETPAGQAVAAPTPAPAAPAGKPAANLEPIELAFCSQVLCVLPFEVARQRGYFAAEGLDVNLTYMRGGAQAINALLAGSVEWVGTPIDLVVQTVAKGKQALMIASTSRLPFFALAVGPQASGIGAVKDLDGKKIGVSNLGTTDHLMAQYLLTREGVDPAKVEFVALGPNLYEQLVRGQVEAGMVQEPSLTLNERAGGRTLVNFMKLEDSQRTLGGPYQFMGLNTRPEVLTAKADTARKLIRGLVKANRWILDNSGEAIVKAAPAEIVAGGDLEVFATSLDRHKNDLYPSDGKLMLDSVQRVIEIQQKSGAIEPGQTVKAEQVFTNQYVESA